MYDLGNMDSMEKRLIQKAYIKQAPINGSLELLPLCNMNCDMCYVRLSKAEMEQKGQLRTKEEGFHWLSDERCRYIIFIINRRGTIVISRI